MANKSIDENSKKVKFLFKPSDSRKAELKRVYERLMDRSKGREKIKFVHERHHILPLSMGGANDPSNIAILTYKEHFLAHWILALITDGANKRKMLKALQRLTYHGEIASGWHFELARKANIEAMVGNTYARGHQNSLGYRMNAAQIEALRLRNTGASSPVARAVRCLDDGRIFVTIQAAAKFYGISSKNIPTVCRGRRPRAGGYRFEYVTEKGNK